jgi:succinate dehydrogenase / fumarate reductase flavoprotein subunit
MEFFQFHPTGIYKMGILISEAVRGEGGILLNGEGERFMERYAPTIKDLAPRDMISRAIYQEIKEGRGVDSKDFVHLDVRHLDPEVIEKKLPDVTEFARIYLGVEPTTELVPIQQIQGTGERLELDHETRPGTEGRGGCLRRGSGHD